MFTLNDSRLKINRGLFFACPCNRALHLPLANRDRIPYSYGMKITAKQNLSLAGFMGTGKTSVGRVLAKRLRMQFADMDQIIETREGRTIPDIFARDGEPFFRELERKLAIELASRNGLVIGCGGGLVLHPENIEHLQRSGPVICLQASPESILARLHEDTGRPLLANLAPNEKLAKIRRLLEARRPFYEQIPLQVETDGKSIKQLADELSALYAAAS